MKLKKIFTKERLIDGYAFLAGALLTLSFAPFSLFPCAIIALCILLWLWLEVSPARAFQRGWWFGMGSFGTGVYWVYISIHDFGDASALLAGFITVGFIAMLALFPAATGYALNRYFPNTNKAKLFFAFPTLWVFLEWSRSWLFSGFPWLSVGYGQMHSVLKGYAQIYGVYGVSLAVLLSSGLIVSAIIQFRQKSTKTLRLNLLALVVLWSAGTYFIYYPWAKPTDKSIPVSLVQGNIPQSLKWSIDAIVPTLKRYQELTQPHWKSKIIIWPEAAVPVILQEAGGFINLLHRQAKQHHATLITGIPIKDETANVYYNGVIAVGNGEGVYLKHRLVPFGEYIPAPAWLSKVLTMFKIPLPNSTASNKPAEPLLADGIKIATFICYEIAFPEQVRASDNQGNIDLLLTVTNDAWFGQSIAQAQHLEMAQMRALEIGRPLLFVSNNGITAIIDAFGKIQTSIPPFEPAVLTDNVQLTTGSTPWQRFGMDPLLVILLTLLYSAIRNRKQK